MTTHDRSDDSAERRRPANWSTSFSYLLTMLLMLAVSVRAVTPQRISALYMHRSVGKSIVQDCEDPRFGARNIRTVLDTLHVIAGDRQARLVFRSANLNGIGGPAVTETTYTDDCAEVEIGPMYSGNSTKVWYNGSCPLLELFADSSKQSAQADSASGQHAWDMFRYHKVRTSASDPADTAWEKYDLVIIKQPYLIWVGFTPERADFIKARYREIRDSVKNYPDIHLAIGFGTPLCYEEPGDLDFNSDTAVAKQVYQLAAWFRDSLDVPDVPNFWAFDCYTSLCEAERVQNRYCLKTDYWGGPTAQSHLSALGAAVGQDTLVAFIARATKVILTAQSGAVTRQDIDLKIRAFRDGMATVQEVIDLINRYNAGQ